MIKYSQLVLMQGIGILTFSSPYSCWAGGIQLEPARYQGLENRCRIVFPCDFSKLAQIGSPVTTERVLRLIGIVQVDVLVRLADGSGILVDLLDAGLANFLEQCIILGIRPGQVGEEDYVHNQLENLR